MPDENEKIKQKRYFWLKLPMNFFDDARIKKLRRIAGGDTYVIIYLKLMLLTINTKGIIEFESIERTVEEELALKLDEDTDNMRIIFTFLRANNELIEMSETEFLINRMQTMIGTESKWASIKREQRKQKEDNVQLLSNGCPENVPLEIDIRERDEIEEKESLSKNQNEQERGIFTKSIKKQLIDRYNNDESAVFRGIGGFKELIIKNGYLHNKLVGKDLSPQEAIDAWGEITKFYGKTK
jgi:predicted phage replisome organizer